MVNHPKTLIRNVLLKNTAGAMNFAKSITDKPVMRNMKKRGNVVEWSLSQESKTLKLFVDGLKEDNWESNQKQCEEVGSLIKQGEVKRIEFHCDDPTEVNLRFIMWVLREVERYKMVEHKEPEVVWESSAKKTYQLWLREMLSKCFDLNIKFPSFLSTGNLV